MGFLKSLLKSKFSEKPEEYKRIYFRWEVGGQEYGPLFFDDMITRNWSGPPIEGRFENENKWHQYDHFIEILNNLKASQNQLSMLNKYNITFDKENLKFREAIRLIEKKEDEFREQRAIEKQEKEKLPATRNTIKKLESYGIKFPENITRAEAKNLISKYEEKEQIIQIIKEFNKRGIDISTKFDIETSLDQTVNKFSFVEILLNLNDLFSRLSEFDITYTLPYELDAESISKINNMIENALFDAEDTEEQIKDREISVTEGDFKIVGALPKNNMKKLNKEVIESHLQGSWNFERDVLKLLRKHFPDIKLKKDEF